LRVNVKGGCGGKRVWYGSKGKIGLEEIFQEGTVRCKLQSFDWGVCSCQRIDAPKSNKNPWDHHHHKCIHKANSLNSFNHHATRIIENSAYPGYDPPHVRSRLLVHALPHLHLWYHCYTHQPYIATLNTSLKHTASTHSY
jgi:hypothetical protein